MQWIVGVLFLVVAGWSATVAHVAGVQAGRSDVANECRQAGAFTVKRTAFKCGVMKR
jgi:hypothetical protein